MASWQDNNPDPRGRATGVAVIIGIILWLLAILFAGDELAMPEEASATSKQASAYTDALVERTTDHFAVRPATTTCASDEAEWSQTVENSGLQGHGVSLYYYGFSYPKAAEVYYSPRVCVGLRRGTVASYRRSNPGRVAWAVNVVVHEAIHVRLITRDEAVTEACAAKYLAAAFNRLYGVKFHTAEMRLLTGRALTMRRQMPPAYQGGRCPV